MLGTQHYRDVTRVAPAAAHARAAMMRSMCGRYANFSSAAQKAVHFGMLDWPEPAAGAARYNIAPGTPIEALRMRNGARHVQSLSWGWVPYWVKDKAIGYKIINARSESAHASAAFRAAYTARRCLIPADGYYEWQRVEHSATRGTAKQPYFVCMRERGVFAFGGLWERWRAADAASTAADATHYSCTILTVAANELTRPIHERMPLIIRPQDYLRWLSVEVDDIAEIQTMIAPYASEAMLAYPVSAQVNVTRIDDESLVVPNVTLIAAQQRLF